jgi:hypothetical protein
MKTAKKLIPTCTQIFQCEIETCSTCGESLVNNPYRSGRKIVQQLEEIVQIAYQPKHCMNPECSNYQHSLKSAQWLQIAPVGCTFGFDVIATLGWRRQTERLIFTDIHADLKTQINISESQVRYLYQHQYLPLLACNERKELDRLKQISDESGLLLSLDGLAPEGGEAQLWTVRELRTGLTVRCGWMSGQDQVSFENFLTPIVASGFRVTEILSDKQRGLLPAIKEVFPDAKHALCQAHYLKNIAEPIAEKDEAMKLELRKAVRASVGPLIRSEHVEKPGVLTVTGLLPSSVEASEPSETFVETCIPDVIQSNPDNQAEERDSVVETIQQRVRYLLTLKGRPPFRLAGVEMYERLSEVNSCLSAMLDAHEDVRLTELYDGVSLALQGVTDTYTELRQAADWLFKISDILEPEDKPVRTGEQVREELQTHIEAVVQQSEGTPRLSEIASKIKKTTNSYAPGLFHTYDVEELPRTNNERESEHRRIMCQLLKTTGQKGAVRRIIQRSGAWEAIPRPDTLSQTIEGLANVAPEDLCKERKRVRNHRNRFKTHIRSAKQSQKQLNKLREQWCKLAA